MWRSPRSQTQAEWSRKENNKRWLNYWSWHDRATAPPGTLHQYFPYNLTQRGLDVPIHKQSVNDDLWAERERKRERERFRTTPMHYWNPGLLVLLLAKLSVFCHQACGRDVTAASYLSSSSIMQRPHPSGTTKWHQCLMKPRRILYYCWSVHVTHTTSRPPH